MFQRTVIFLCEIIRYTEKLCVLHDFLHHTITCRINLHD